MRRLFDRRDMSWHEVSYRAKGAFAVLLSLAIIVGGSLFVYNKISDAWREFRTADDYIGQGEKDVRITVPDGAPIYEISDILVENDVIKSAKTFDAEASQISDISIQSGTYRMRTKLPAKVALEMLTHPDEHLARNKVTVIEGLRLSDQLARLSAPRNEKEPGKSGTGVSAEEFQKVLSNPELVKTLGMPEWVKGNPEGVLFPDTYNFPEDVTAVAALQRMVKGFNQAIQEIDFIKKCKDNQIDPYSALIVASIIEHEVRNPKDGPKVARVLYNRMANDSEEIRKLKLDSTVYYAVSKKPGVELSQEDLASDNPYNTYTHEGLPPGPLDAPGKAALLAAAAPEPGAWLFFTTVNYETGETKFENNDQEHAANVEVFRKWCAEHKDKCTHN